MAKVQAINCKSIFEDQEQAFALPEDSERALSSKSSLQIRKESPSEEYEYKKDAMFDVKKYNSNDTSSMPVSKAQEEAQDTPFMIEQSRQSRMDGINRQVNQDSYDVNNERDAGNNQGSANSKNSLDERRALSMTPPVSSDLSAGKDKQTNNLLSPEFSSKRVSQENNNSPSSFSPESHNMSQIKQYIMKQDQNRRNKNSPRSKQQENTGNTTTTNSIKYTKNSIGINQVKHLNTSKLMLGENNLLGKTNLDFAERIFPKNSPNSSIEIKTERLNRSTDRKNISGQFSARSGSSYRPKLNDSALKRAKENQLMDFISFQKICSSLESPKSILFEGELFKYKPGLNYNFISRYLCLSLETIRYYKDRVSSKCYPEKPLFELPLSCISSVSQVSFNVPLLPKEFQRQLKATQRLHPENGNRSVSVNYFEIVTNAGALKSVQTENDSIFSNRPPQHLMPQDKLGSKKNGQLNKQIKDLTTWSGRSHEWYESEERMLFCSQEKQVLDTWVAVLNWTISQECKSQTQMSPNKGELSERRHL